MKTSFWSPMTWATIPIKLTVAHHGAERQRRPAAMHPTTRPAQGPRLPIGVGRASLAGDSHHVVLDGDRAGDVAVHRIVALEDLLSSAAEGPPRAPRIVLVR